MDYERIIVELLSRIQVLEDKVEFLMETKDAKKEKVMVTTDDIREYINELKIKARASGKSKIIVKSGDIHNDLDLKSRMPMVCNAMRDCMKSGDVVLHTTPSGYSSTIEIEYKL